MKTINLKEILTQNDLDPTEFDSLDLIRIIRTLDELKEILMNELYEKTYADHPSTKYEKIN